MTDQETSTPQFETEAATAIRNELTQLWRDYFKEKFKNQPKVLDGVLKRISNIGKEYADSFDTAGKDEEIEDLISEEIDKISRSTLEGASAEAFAKQIRALGTGTTFNNPKKARIALNELAAEKKGKGWSNLSQDPVLLATERVLNAFGEEPKERRASIESIISDALVLVNKEPDKVKSVTLIELNNQHYKEISEFISKTLDGDSEFIASKTDHLVLKKDYFLHKKRDDLQEFYIKNLKDTLSERPFNRAKKDIEQIFEEVLAQKIDGVIAAFQSGTSNAEATKEKISKLYKNTESLNMPLLFRPKQKFWEVVTPKLDSTVAKMMEAQKANISKILQSAIDGKMGTEGAAKGIEVNINKSSEALDLICAFDRRPKAREEAIDRMLLNLGKETFSKDISTGFYKINQKENDESTIAAKQAKLLTEKSNRLFELTDKLSDSLSLPDSDNTAKTIIDSAFWRLSSEYSMLAEANLFFANQLTQATQAKVGEEIEKNLETLEKRFQIQTLAFTRMTRESDRYQSGEREGEYNSKAHYNRMYSLRSTQMDQVKTKEANSALADSLYEIETYDRDPKEAVARMPEGFVKDHASDWAKQYDTLFRMGPNVKRLADAILRVNNKLANELDDLAKPNYTAYHFNELAMKKQSLSNGISLAG